MSRPLLDRRLLLTGLAAAPLVAQAVPAQPVRRLPETVAPTRIAFGSCAHQTKDQPIWDAILAAKPDLMILLGDNVYLDTRNVDDMKAKYAMLAAKPGFQKLRDAVPIVATWDDHDFGENDAGAEYPMKAESRKLFCDFFGEAPNSIRRTQPDGIYTAYEFGPRGRRLQIILPDLRWNRTPLATIDMGGKEYKEWATARHEAGQSVPGPYARLPEGAATQLGEAQWQWLEGQLSRPADLRILASSLQVVSDFPGWEAWINFTHDHQRLIEAIRERKANGLFCISGDTHYAEISKLDWNVPYPLWDFTSSGLTEVWPVLPPNARRVGEAYRAQNFGLIEIDWPAGRVVVTIRDVGGAEQLRQVLDLKDLRVG